MGTAEQVALVTGGASGMGRIYARRLAARGTRVAIFDVNQQGLEATAAGSDNITAFHCDIASLEDVNHKVAQVEQQLGAVDLLVHAAALMPAYPLAEHSHEGMEQLFRINYFGTTYMVRAVLPSMQARKTGRIIAFGSIAGTALVPKMGAYCATKAAVNAYIEVLQNEIRASGVRAHLVCPPAVNTPLIDQTLETDSPGSIRESREKGRLADPEKMIDAIERGVARDKDIIYPSEARLLFLWRTLAPRLWWKTVMKFEQ
ncbi:SDR family NAD(P)-dependent oxidoreductase [Seongchinamella sediminis]|uniref:SDR family NAD(P)-dependent oxidoreductase n=1 Tax=Seongchinamella sediminis TaxID=2283635 RepID=A0A3L7E1T9_9GAMM|nr:SDR family oxidoreductase [Seongchinamella sediminis]RLQ22112.1 SDR family NAD(P)-dependent oxidoreductase [Seongchinamella sediminis]